MRLEVKDVESSTVYTIDASGAVLGRERARTDINFRDESISKRHARVFAEGGVWYVEDLGSSNGTYVRDQRISEPTPLTTEASFTLAQRRFEIVHIEGADGGAAAPTGPDAEAEAEEGAPSAGVGAIALAVPKAVAFYLASVPMMALNPLGSFRKIVDEQPWPARAPLELAAYGLVAGFVASVLSSVFGLVAGLVQGVFSFGGLVAALPAAGVAAVIGAVGGFLVHPVLGWLVRVLRGDSSPRSRTHFALGFYVFSILATVPSGLGALLALLPIPFMGLVTTLLSLVVSLLGVVLAHRWAVAFGVVKGVRVFLVAVGVVALLAGGAQALRVIFRSPGPAVAASGEDGQDDLRAMAAQAAQRAAAAEATATAEGDADTEPGVEVSPTTPSEAGDATPAPVDTNPSEAPDAPAPDPDRGAAASAPVVSEAAVAAEHPRGLTDFARYRMRRAAIERAVEDDPALLDRKDVLDDYQPMWRTISDVEDRWRKLMRGKPRWQREKILGRKRDLEIYRRTHPYVDRLSATLFGEPPSQ